jgi:hypothetical protein
VLRVYQVTATTLTRPKDEPAYAEREHDIRRMLTQWLPLMLILTVQAVYTIRLIPVGYLGNDEARYVVAGHVLLHELFRSVGSPYYETFFSGAPDFYSPLAAIADYVGGIVAVRLLSMCFTLTATYLLFRTSERLIGYVGALCSAGLFAGLGMTQAVGRNTIYDAMAFMIVALAGYCAVRARDGGAKWLLLVPLTLFAAYFAKYMTILFDPAVIALASLGIGSWRRVARRIFTLAFATGCMLGLGTFLAGGAYLHGMMFSVFSRQRGVNNLMGAQRVSAHFILAHVWTWMGALIVLSILAVAVAFVARRSLAPVLAVCALAGILVSLEALHLHSNESMRRHDDLGAWFAAIPAGYLMALPSQVARKLGLRRALGGAALIALIPFWARYSQPASTFSGATGYDTGNLGNPAPFAGALKPYLLPGHEYLLSGLDNFATIYDDHLTDALPWYAYATDDNYIKYPIPGRGGEWSGRTPGRACESLQPGCMYLEGRAGYQAAIAAHAFAMVELSRHSISTDAVIATTVSHTHGYVQLLQKGRFDVWIYLPDYEHRSTARV